MKKERAHPGVEKELGITLSGGIDIPFGIWALDPIPLM
jgi:hypothetical protein